MTNIQKWPVDNPTMHFSVDDVRGVCMSLKDGKKKSIFEDSTLCMLYHWHKKYGIVASLYVQGDFSVNAKYANEVVANADWLRWGYHGIGSQRQKRGIEDFHRQVLDSMGTTEMIDKSTRIDYYHADLLTCLRLRRLGYKAFYTADDWRFNSHKREPNYYLTSEQSQQIDSADIIQDPTNDIIFIKTDMRIEHIKDMYGSVQNVKTKLLSHSKRHDLLVAFTHEKHVIEYQETIDSLFAAAIACGYSFNFPY